MKIAVIGAGVVGLWIALLANEKGSKVTVIEESNKPGRGASGHNAGVVHLLQPPFDSLKSRLALEGNREYDEWSQRLGFRLKRTRLVLATTHPLAPVWVRAVAWYLRRRGFPTSIASPRLVRENLCPQLSRSVRGVVVVDGYGVVDPHEVLQRLAEALGEEGVDLRWECRVKKLKQGRDKVAVESECSGEEVFDRVVVAAGAGSRDIALASGAWAPRQYFARGVMAEADLRGDCEAIVSWLPHKSPRQTKGGGIIPQLGGGHLLGPDFQVTHNPWDTTASKEEAQRLVDRFKPLLEEEPLLRDWFAGTRVVNTPEDDFVIYRWGKSVFLYGIDSPGFTAAPALARLVVGELF